MGSLTTSGSVSRQGGVPTVVPKVFDATGPDIGLPPGRPSVTVRETGLA